MEPISLALSAIKVAASIGSFLEARKTRKILESKQADTLDQHRRDVLLVLGTLGEALLRLGIVEPTAVPAAWEDVRRCLQLKAPEIRAIFVEELERPMQYAVAVSVVFCAVCWPMHIHRGFGCSVLNDLTWNAIWDYSKTLSVRFTRETTTPLTSQEPVLLQIDDCIAIMKTSVQNLGLFRKVPSGLSQIAVTYTNNGNEKYKKKARAWLNDVYAEVRKRGPPQPKDGSFQSTEVIVGFVTWMGSQYANVFGEEDPYLAVKSQGDPGKLLYAYTIGNQLDLQPGQILMPIDRIQHILLTWLEGLDGMVFKLLPDEDFDDKHPKFKKKNRWVFEWNTASINVVAVRDYARVQQRHRSSKQQEYVAVADSSNEKKKKLPKKQAASPTTQARGDSTINKPPSKPARKTNTTSSGVDMKDEHASSLGELFLVLNSLGQRLLSLGVIDDSALPASEASVSRSISAISKDLSQQYGEHPISDRYSITCAIIFCAACFPMHIYRGFGCGVLDNVLWGLHADDPSYPDDNGSPYLGAMDKVLAYQKSLPDSLRLLKKVPVGVDRELPKFTPTVDDDEDIALIRQLCEARTEAFERNGFPRPLDRRIQVTSWEEHFATWQGAVIYEITGHEIYNSALWQADPGRMLYGWTVWNRLHLKPGQAVTLPGDHSSHLVMWLEGLNGMTFKVLRDEELDYSHIKYSQMLSDVMQRQTGNVHGITGVPWIVVLDPKFLPSTPPALEATFSDLGLDSDTASVKSSFSESGTLMPEPAGRRPPPPPPRRSTKAPEPRRAKAKYGFTASASDELSFTAGDVLEIVDDKGEDGWWTARSERGTGLIPASYVAKIPLDV